MLNIHMLLCDNILKLEMYENLVFPLFCIDIPIDIL